MGSMFKQGIFNEHVHGFIEDWAADIRSSKNRTKGHKLAKQSNQDVLVAAEQAAVVIDGTTTSVTDFFCSTQLNTPSS